MIAYLKENPVLAIILAVCLVVILLTAAAMIAGKKKQTRRASVPDTSETQKNELPEESAPSHADDMPAVTAEKMEDPETTQATDIQAGTTEMTETTEKSAPTETPAPEDVKRSATSVTENGQNFAPVSSSATKKAENSASGRKNPNQKKKKNKNKYREGSMYLEDLKNAPIEDENDFYDEEDEADRIAKYSGKWVICRVVTAAAPDSGDVIRSGENGEEMYFFELRASNGEKLLTSEEYTTYAGALNGIETHKANIARNNFKIMLSKKGDYIFKLLSGKNMLLCMGEHYATRARCESAIESAKRFAKTAIVDENVQDIVITPPPEENEESLPEFPDNGYNGKWIVRSSTAEDGEEVFYFELYASNGEKLLSSEEYTTYVGAINGIETHKANIARGNFRISLTKRGDYIYKLLNGNGQLLCLGEHYKTKKRCENAVESVKRFARNAPVLTDPDTVKNA